MNKISDRTLSWVSRWLQSAPPLHRAAYLGDHTGIRKLVSSGHDTSELATIDDHGPFTPLMMAAGSCLGASVETIDLLIDLGADPSICANESSAATVAMDGIFGEGGDIDRFERLVQVGAPFEFSGKVGGRSLEIASGRKDIARLRALLQGGADPNGWWDQQSELQAKQNFLGHLQMRRTSMESEGVSDDLINSLYAYAVKSVDEHHPPKAPRSSEIPLFIAVERGHFPNAKLLLQFGADPHKRDNSGRTAITYASSIRMIRLLESYGLSLEDGDNIGYTALENAVSDGDNKRVHAMIAAGANVNCRDAHGWTVLMLAVMCIEKKPSIQKALIKAGADPLSRSDYGFNLFHAAVDWQGHQRDMRSAIRRNFRFIKSLGVDINQHNEDGQTPLGRAILDGAVPEVELLLELGADPNIRCIMPDFPEDGECCEWQGFSVPPVISAIRSHNVRYVRKLLQYGADVNLRDHRGRTALEYAFYQLQELKEWGEEDDLDDQQRNSNRQSIRQARAIIRLLRRLWA